MTKTSKRLINSNKKELQEIINGQRSLILMVSQAQKKMKITSRIMTGMAQRRTSIQTIMTPTKAMSLIPKQEQENAPIILRMERHPPTNITKEANLPSIVMNIVRRTLKAPSSQLATTQSTNVLKTRKRESMELQFPGPSALTLEIKPRRRLSAKRKLKKWSMKSCRMNKRT